MTEIELLTSIYEVLLVGIAQIVGLLIAIIAIRILDYVGRKRNGKS